MSRYTLIITLTIILLILFTACPVSSFSQNPDMLLQNDEKAMAIGFLLLGHYDFQPEMIMIISLVPEQAATLLSISPGSESVKNQNPVLTPNAADRPNVDKLTRHLAEISGTRIDFVLWLDLEGVKEMIDFMGGIRRPDDNGAGFPSYTGGAEVLNTLIQGHVPPRDKQLLLRTLLLQLSELEFTKVGLTLLKIGYRSLNTNLTIGDLIKLRKVTHSITPYQTVYRELP